MLREVTRPDKSCVSFQYDTFGRRIEKSVTSIHSKGASEGRQQKVIRFLWNGNNLFHEWEEKSTVGRRKTENKVDFKADYILKLEKREEEKAKKEAGQDLSLHHILSSISRVGAHMWIKQCIVHRFQT